MLSYHLQASPASASRWGSAALATAAAGVQTKQFFLLCKFRWRYVSDVVTLLATSPVQENRTLLS